MIFPFHCVLHCDRKGSSSLIIAASGEYIYSFAASTGAPLSSWSQSEGSIRAIQRTRNNGAGSLDHGTACTDRPVKRRRLSGSAEVSDSTSAEIVIDNDTKKHRRRKAKVPPVAAVISIMVNSNGKHIVAVTGEDKCIRVLEVLADDTMHQISERHMPKRPCSVMFTTDESMILCADKFGDVYALPLFEQYVDKKDGMNEQPMALDQPKEEAKSKSFVPAATALTVHTKRNQQALKHQQSVKSKTSEKKSLNFAHQLLLGHVSLLTDLAYVSVCVGESTSSSTRSYLLTSDRDEHIRISRGLPQAHIIEGYCLGHTEFVSKLCIPPWDSSFLVSGGGDDYLLVWKWLSSEVQQRVELKSLVAIFGKRIRQEPRGGIEQSTIAAGTGSIAVTGIWAIRTPISENEKYEGFIIVACERVPAFFVYSWHENGKVEHHETLEVEGNILDVAVLQTQMAILYTIDSQEHYSPATDEQLRHHLPCLGSYCYLSATRSWVRDSPIQESVDGINEWAAMQEINAPDRGFQNSLMHEYLYGTEKLRKRGQDED